MRRLPRALAAVLLGAAVIVPVTTACSAGGETEQEQVEGEPGEAEEGDEDEGSGDEGSEDE